MEKHPITKEAVKQVLLDYWREYKKHPWRTVTAFLAPAIGSILVTFVPPLIVANLINSFTKYGILLSAAWFDIALFGILWLLGEILSRLGMHYLIALEANAVAFLGKSSLEQLNTRDYDFYANNFVGSLTKMANAYSRGFEIFTDVLSFNVISNAIPALFAVIVLGFYSPWISVMLIVCLIVAIAVAFPLIRHRSKLVAERHVAGSRMSGRLSDSLTNIMAVKSFAQETAEQGMFGELVDDYKLKFTRAANYQNLRSEAVISPIYVASNVVGLIAAIFFAQKFSLQVGTVFVVFSYYSSVTGIFWNTTRIYRQVESSIGEAAEFTQLFLEPPKVEDKPNASTLTIHNPSISFRDVGFTYGENAELFLKDFNLDIKANQKVGLVGPSGGGKTTITKLILRFIDLQTGEISIDGEDISAVTQVSLRSNIAYVPQEPLLFHRSLFENIAYGKPGATLDEVMYAAKLAHAHEFIGTLPKGYDTVVGERGIKLSGGQRQRVAIARAILKQAPILVLDEATSSLDSESEKYIQDGLHELMKDKTALVIAHRLSTIKHLDRIIVMDGGRIVQDGTHDELIGKPGLYAKLWSHQTGEFLEEE